MDRIDLSRDHPSLEELVARAAAGETVEIVSDGKLTARISPVEALNETPKAPFDFESLRALHARQIAAGGKDYLKLGRRNAQIVSLLMIYLDASLIVSAVVIEDASPQIVTWLLQQEPKSLIASDWALVEVASALAFKQRTGQISEDIRGQAIAAWSDMRASKVDLVPVPSLAFANAESWLNGGLTKFRSGDALHISIAQLGGYSLATLDKAMIEAAALLGVAVEPIS